MARAEISVYFDLRRKRYDRLKKMSKDLGFSKSAILSCSIDFMFKQKRPEDTSTEHRRYQDFLEDISD